jgi:hypothetical protein
MPDKPRQIGEKQASSEIAEFTWNDHAEEFLMEHYPNIRGKWRFLVPILGAFAEKVERDTRERVAQLLEKEAEGRSATDAVRYSLEFWAERIRGKE